MSETDVKRVEVFGLRVFSDDLDRIPLSGRCATVSTISPNSYGLSTRDPEFRRALVEADYLVLDGVYFALGAILLKGRAIRANQGPDVFAFFMRKLASRGGRVFFLGSSEATLANIRGIDLESAVIHKYGRACPGCQHIPCVCDPREKP